MSAPSSPQALVGSTIAWVLAGLFDLVAVEYVALFFSVVAILLATYAVWRVVRHVQALDKVTDWQTASVSEVLSEAEDLDRRLKAANGRHDEQP